MQMDEGMRASLFLFVLENVLGAGCSQEVVGRSACHVGFASARGWVKHEVRVVHLFVDLHDASFVAASVAVIWRRKNRDDLLFMGPVVSL